MVPTILIYRDLNVVVIMYCFFLYILLYVSSLDSQVPTLKVVFNSPSSLTMHLTLLLLFSPLILLSCYLLHKIIWVPFRFKKHFHEQGVRGPDYRPIFGNSAEMRRRLIAEAESRPISGKGISHDIAQRVVPHYSRWSTLYGKNFLYWFGANPRLAIADRDMIKEVLVNSNGSFQKVELNPSSKMLFGDGLVALEGEKWGVHRRITSQAFNMERVKVIFIPLFLFFIFDLN